jgi:hypothetical protein
MVMYAFEKLYTDLVADDGTVCILYLTWTELLGVRHASAGYELYTPDGRREVVHARSTPALPDLGASEWSVRLDVPGGPFELRQTVTSGAWTPEGTLDGLHWSVKVARADAEARWLGDPSRAVLRGPGYADWVALQRMTRGLGMRRVDWGRAHVGDATWIWNRIRLADGTAWTRGLRSDDAGRGEWQDLDLSDHAGGARMTPPDGRALHLDEGRVLHEGPAVDRERFPSAIARGVAKLVTPPMDETRWVRRARAAGAGEGWALHERVRFGAES